MKQKIGYLTGEYPRATDTFIQREVAALREHGVQVQTFAIRRPGGEHSVGQEQIREREQTKYILPASIVSIVKSHFSLLIKSPKRYFTAMGVAFITRSPGLKALIYQVFYFIEAGILARWMNQDGLTHLHNHFANSSCSVAMLSSILGGYTYSFTTHGPAIFFEPMRWRIDEKIKRALFVSCISHYCRSQLMIWTKPEKYNRLHIVHCGVDPGLMKVRDHSGVGSRLLYVGRLAAVKGLPILLEALAKLRAAEREMKLTVVGDGPDRALLEKMAGELGLTDCVEFAGYQSQDEVREHLAKTDVFVMSSFAEGVPVVLMEAMAAGVPVVATRIAGVSELVDDGVSGYVINPGDRESLAAAIVKLVEDDNLRNRFGNAGRAKVETEFDIYKESKWLMTIMTEAMEGRVEAIRPGC